jgi:hypothetical protein
MYLDAHGVSTLLFRGSENIKSLYITSDRNDVTAADNPTNNDTYEYIEGTTSNQTKKGRNYNIHLSNPIGKTKEN